MSGSRILARVAEDFDWQAYLEGHFFCKYIVGKNGPELRVDCPHPDCDDHKKKCYVNLDLGLFNCYKCGFSSRNGDVFDFVAVTEDIPRPHAMQRLLREYRDTTPEDNILEEILQQKLEPATEKAHDSLKTIQELPSQAKRLQLPMDVGSKPFWRYLINERGLTATEVQQMQAHYVHTAFVPVYKADGKMAGNLGRRVLWPIYGGDAELVGWQARSIEDSKQKYLNNPESDMGKTLWPYIKPKSESVVLVEGVLDAMAVRRVGSHVSPYATFSKAISSHQILLLKEWGVTEINLLWDIKDAAQQMVQAVDTLTVNFQVNILDTTSWEKDVDPGNCLSLPNGTYILEEALQKQIDTTSLEYIRWQMQVL